jgi:hypothetical protein
VFTASVAQPLLACTIETCESCERFSSGFDKNLLQASKIFFLCQNGEMILIPTCSILSSNPLHNNLPPCQSYSLVVAARAKMVMVAPRPQQWTYWQTCPWWTRRFPCCCPLLVFSCVSSTMMQPSLLFYTDNTSVSSYN